MHRLGVFHQDVKVENILLGKDGLFKLCDFGSCSSERIDLEQVSKSKMYHYEERFEKNTTLMYRPPEMIDLYLKYPIDDRVDVWMLGCVLFVLNYHFHPFQEEGKLSIVNASIKYKPNH
jgi:AP2-associated kinase